jgi:hypothetical protein
MTTHTLISFNQWDTLYHPSVINLTDRPHKVKRRELLTIANHFLPGSVALGGDDAAAIDHAQPVPPQEKSRARRCLSLAISLYP